MTLTQCDVMIANRILCCHYLFLRKSSYFSIFSALALKDVNRKLHNVLIGPKPGFLAIGNIFLQSYRIDSRQICTSGIREKYKNPSKDEDFDEDDENDPTFKDERDSKVIKAKVNSLRADLVLRAGLKTARNKIEVLFYESRIRVNGEKITKKSMQLQIGDEIDVVKGFSNVNPSHLIVSRVIILSGSEAEDGVNVHLRRYKSLLIDNYAGINAYKSSEAAASS